MSSILIKITVFKAVDSCKKPLKAVASFSGYPLRSIKVYSHSDIYSRRKNYLIGCISAGREPLKSYLFQYLFNIVVAFIEHEVVMVYIWSVLCVLVICQRQIQTIGLSFLPQFRFKPLPLKRFRLACGLFGNASSGSLAEQNF